MPAPRAARQTKLMSRKSEVRDRDLYDAPLDDSDSDSAPLPPPPTTKYTKSSGTTSSTLTTGTSRGGATGHATTTIESPRRSARQGVNRDSPVAPPPPVATSRQRTASPSKHAAAAPPPPRGAKVVPRSRARDEDDDGDDGDWNNNAAANSAMGTTRTRTSPRGKRQRTDAPTMGGEGASASDAIASTSRTGFVPRAATQHAQAAKVKPTFAHTLADTSNDDAQPFAFTTNPPTPHNSSSTSRAPKQGRAHANFKNAPRAAMRVDETAPIASTSRLSPPSRTVGHLAPIHAAETPVQNKNRAFRQGDATPATPGISVRRSSVKGSGRRGSSIGGGFEVPPHVSVPDDKLYRQTNAEDPVARRLRSILSWTAQRQRDRVFASTSVSPNSRACASAVIDQFISGICDSSIDVSVPFQPGTSDSSANDGLPQHPQNESNTARLIECKANHDAIGKEQERRKELEPIYNDFAHRRAQARALDLPTIDEASLSFDLSTPTPTSIEQALKLGESILSGSSFVKGKGRASDVVEDETLASLSNVRFEMAQFRVLAHRLTQFTNVSSAFVDERIRQAHRALTLESTRGLASTASTATNKDASNGPVIGGIAQLGLAVPSGSGSTTTATPGPDARDLLRAIANTDLKTGRSRPSGAS
ncbi:BQ2448_2444 [Microbotryum intermedium]|uniref:BQ2448_2444 protein n=1 Tax=Microbotryum intermedium TaxID=269621 RepID=A0A238FC02_9BASI|nr:BQ2448_2444 [Microbotryum intermedium]